MRIAEQTTNVHPCFFFANNLGNATKCNTTLTKLRILTEINITLNTISLFEIEELPIDNAGINAPLPVDEH
jgi:hypothetical protein